MRKTTNTPPKAARQTPPARQQWKVRHILVPLDFSGWSRQALNCAVPLARKHRAKISLVHVAQSPVVMRTFPEDGVTAPMNTDRLVSLAKAQLDELAAQLLPDGLRGRTVVRKGNPTREVVATAKALKVDLIVLSTTGRSGLSRVLLGSTAERIVRHAHCPVLTVRRQTDTPPKSRLPQPVAYPKELPWQRILVPIDFSLTSLRALQAAVLLARASNAQLLLLNVVVPNPYPTGMESAVLVLPDVDIARIAKQQLAQVVRRFVPKSVRATPLIGHGRAASVIVSAAEEKKVDLIALSTHGHTGFDRLLMGSTAEQVVRHARCPVFVVRTPRER